MLSTFRTLMIGSNARADEKRRDTYAIELLDQKIREANAGLKAAKATLASLIQRQRGEQAMLGTLTSRIDDMTRRARQAIEAGRDDLANEAATTIASMENEQALRRTTIDRLDVKVIRLRASVESGSRSILELKQGAAMARAVRSEQKMQTHLRTTPGSDNAMKEAEEMIAAVLNADDPFEKAEIMAEIEDGLTNETLPDRMADAGFGKATKVSAADVLARLNTTTEKKD